MPPGEPDAPAVRLASFDHEAIDELSAALSLTRRGAETLLGYAFAFGRLPQVADLLARGLIDYARFRVITDETCHLEDDEAAAVVDPITIDAPDLTTGQLGARLRRCMDTYPERAVRRYQRGLGDRRLEREQPRRDRRPLGPSTPRRQAAAVYDHINRLAHHQRGHDGRTMDQVRADIFLQLLQGHHPNDTRASDGADEIRVDLTTLIGFDDHAGDIVGWGPVIADLARQIVDRQPDTTWTVIITDPDTGSPIHTGITRRRTPLPNAATSPPATPSAYSRPAACPRPPATSTTPSTTPTADPPPPTTSDPSAPTTTS